MYVNFTFFAIGGSGDLAVYSQFMIGEPSRTRLSKYSVIEIDYF